MQASVMEIKFLLVGQAETGFRLSKNYFYLSRNADLKQIIFIY